MKYERRDLFDFKQLHVHLPEWWRVLVKSSWKVGREQQRHLLLGKEEQEEEARQRLHERTNIRRKLDDMKLRDIQCTMNRSNEICKRREIWRGYSDGVSVYL